MLFGRKSKKKSLAHADWRSMENSEMLNRAYLESELKTVVLFKHSTRCSISAFVQKRVASDWNFDSNKVSFYHLDLIKLREISNEIATLTGVVHQSPQMIVLSNKKVTYHASHENISIEEMSKTI